MIQFKVRDDSVSMRVENVGVVGIGDGTNFRTDHTLSLSGGVLSVNTTNYAEADNTLPITSAGVHRAVGNIEELLKTI
jgi:hypothetical protein